jgi:L-Ala-D/L-Glu epimerase
MTPKIQLRILERELPLKAPFTIARETWTSARNVFVTAQFGDAIGRGESDPGDRWGESVESVMAQLEAIDPSDLKGPFDLEGVSALLPPGAARAALDIALHDLGAQLAGLSLAELLGLGGRSIPPTSVTISISDPDAMVTAAREVADHPALKVKVGFEGDVEVVRAVRSAYSGKIRIDANEGWDVESAVSRLDALAALDIELCEQPIPAGNLEGLKQVTEASRIPIFADEDACTAADVARLAGCVDGVNLKLGKSGGIREFVRAVAVARAHGLGVMIGCNLETGIATAAGVAVASLVDYADLDGPLILAEDPFPGISYERGSISLKGGPGLGVEGLP